MNKKKLYQRVKKYYGSYYYTDIQRIIDRFIYELNLSLLRGEKVRIYSWGIFKVVKRKALQIRSLKTGKIVEIPASYRIKFKEGRVLKRLLNERRNRKNNRRA